MKAARALKRAAKQVLGNPHLRRALDPEPIRGLLGNTRLYPEWERRVRAQYEKYPDWKSLIADEAELWAEAKASAEGPVVLITSSAMTHALDALLAVALTLRGARVELLVCDDFLPACFFQQVYQFPDTADYAKHGPTRGMCRDCFSYAARGLDELGLRYHRQSQLVTPEDLAWAAELARTLPADEIKGYHLDGVSIGEHAWANALRYYTVGDLAREPHGEPILRMYFRAALLTCRSGQRLTESGRFEALVTHHGLYVPHGVFVDGGHAWGLRVTTFIASYRKQTFMFTHDGPPHRELLREPDSAWEDTPWTDAMRQEILQYLQSRWNGTDDWISYQENTLTDRAAIATELGIDASRPTIGLLTNVIWDSQLFHPTNAFPVMMDWLEQTIDWFAERPHLQLLVRTHPAENRSRERVIDRIREKYPELPANVIVVPPERRLNTYAAMDLCDSVLIYGTKAGIELAPMGIPVIVAGEAWLRGKDISYDASSQEEYFAMLEKLPFGKRMDEARVERALKYAYHLFLRRMIPLEFFRPPALPVANVEVNGLRELLPGQSTGLDVICDGILTGSEYLYPVEQYAPGGEMNGGPGRSAAAVHG